LGKQRRPEDNPDNKKPPEDGLMVGNAEDDAASTSRNVQAREQKAKLIRLLEAIKPPKLGQI
jgi:hypothetical protein